MNVTVSMMDDYDFTKEEIRQELENLGYYNVNDSRLLEFKQDLQRLVQFERSKNSSDASSESSSIAFTRNPAANVQLLEETPFETNRTSQHQVDSNNTRHHIHFAGVSHAVDQSRHDKENVSNFATTQPYRKRYDVPVVTVPSAGEHVNVRPDDDMYDLGVIPSPQFNPSLDVTTASSTASDGSIRRKVLRKIDGHSRVFNESSDITTGDEADVDSLEDRLRAVHVAVPGIEPYISYNPSRPRSAYGPRPPLLHQEPTTRRPKSAMDPCSYRLPDYYDGPKALIKPMSVEPHVRNIKRSDPVARYMHYRQSWDCQRAPGEQSRKNLRWNVREHMLYHDAVIKKSHHVYIPNSYVIPADKKRKKLRWQIRNDMAQGVVPPSEF